MSVSPKGIFKTLIGTGIAGGATLAAYALLVRPWHLRWGATSDEAARVLPGDELIEKPRLSATHGITIDAPPEAVWPWLKQMGAGKAGFYSYDWIESLMGLEKASAEEIIPELQEVRVGEVLPITPQGEGIPIALLEDDKHLVLFGRSDTDEAAALKRVHEPKSESYLLLSWGFYLEALPENKSRLLERVRMSWKGAWLQHQLFYRGVLEPGSFIMERKMLLGIKQRAEAAHKADQG